MNRRKFFNMLGKAVVGGAVAYSFPEILVPKNITKPTGLADAIEKGYRFWGVDGDLYSCAPINFSDLEEAYKKACVGNNKPKYVVVNKTMYDFLTNGKRLSNESIYEIFSKDGMSYNETKRLYHFQY